MRGAREELGAESKMTILTLVRIAILLKIENRRG